MRVYRIEHPEIKSIHSGHCEGAYMLRHEELSYSIKDEAQALHAMEDLLGAIDDGMADRLENRHVFAFTSKAVLRRTCGQAWKLKFRQKGLVIRSYEVDRDYIRGRSRKQIAFNPQYARIVNTSTNIGRF